MPFKIVKDDLASMTVDAIVYADNPQPLSRFMNNSAFLRGNAKELLKSRESLGAISIGDVKIVPASPLDAKYIIHTSGPVWHGGLYNEKNLLRSCYKNIFDLALKHQCSSIALPVISSESLGFPKKLAIQIAFECIHSFLQGHDLMIYIVVPNKTALIVPAKQFSAVRSYVNKNYEENIAVPETGTSKEQIASTEQTFSAAMLQCMTQKNLTPSDVYKKANLDFHVFSKISDEPNYRPCKNHAISLGIALKLSLDEMKEFIGKSGYALTHGSKFDLIIEYYILQKNYDMIEINQMLFKFDQPLLGCETDYE